ncbi:MAG: hypothetical protein NVSMB24_21200 [Mucilaginibacter sp.]
MDKENKVKPPKKRAEKYDAKLSINATFDQVIVASFLNKAPLKKDK